MYLEAGGAVRLQCVGWVTLFANSDQVAAETPAQWIRPHQAKMDEPAMGETEKRALMGWEAWEGAERWKGRRATGGATGQQNGWSCFNASASIVHLHLHGIALHGHGQGMRRCCSAHRSLLVPLRMCATDVIKGE